MRIPMSEPGVEKSDEIVPASAVNGDRIVDRTGSDVKADKMRGVDVEMERVAHPMASVASPSMPAAKFSVETALLFPFLSTLVEDVIWPNSVDPRRQHATVGFKRERRMVWLWSVVSEIQTNKQYTNKQHVELTEA